MTKRTIDHCVSALQHFAMALVLVTEAECANPLHAKAKERREQIKRIANGVDRISMLLERIE